jgi:hypothetical protein
VGGFEASGLESGQLSVLPLLDLDHVFLIFMDNAELASTSFWMSL